MTKTQRKWDELLNNALDKWQVDKGILLKDNFSTVKAHIHQRDAAIRAETIKEVVEELEFLAKKQISQKSLYYPEYIEGINKAGKQLKEAIDHLKEQLEGK